jgi:glycogen synthase
MDPADRAVIGMIGRLDPQKGFDLLAGAAPASSRGRG